MSDWSGWAAMTGVDKKLWESEWVAFIVATSPRGNALGRVATLSLALWSQQSLSTIPICSLVPLFLTHAEFEPMKESNETRLEPADNFRVLPWGRLRFNGRDHSILPSACLLHLVLFAWFKKNRGGKKRIERQPRKGQLRHLHLCHCHVSATPYAAPRCQYVPLLWCK